MLNKVQLIGHVGHDLEVRATPTGKIVTGFDLATDQRYPDGHRRTDWHRVVLWGAAAVNAGRILGRGSLVYVEGRLETRPWKDRESGAVRYRSEVVGLLWEIPRQPPGAPETEPPEDPASEGSWADS